MPHGTLVNDPLFSTTNSKYPPITRFLIIWFVVFPFGCIADFMPSARIRLVPSLILLGLSLVVYAVLNAVPDMLMGRL